MWATLFVFCSVNHMSPSGPATMPVGELDAVAIGNVVTVPDGVTRPISFELKSVNQTFPSGPPATPRGLPVTGNSVIAPAGVIFATLFPRNSTNQTLPSGPAAI